MAINSVAGAADAGSAKIPFKRILLAVNESEASHRAVRLAAELAHSTHSQLHVIHLRDSTFLGRGSGYWELETREEAERFVADVKSELERAGVEAKSSIEDSLTGEEGEHIVNLATNLGADLIVIGTRGISTFGALFSKSVSHAVVNKSKIPILIVP